MQDPAKSIWLPEQLHRRLKMEAARQGRSITDVLAEAVRCWLKKHEGKEQTPESHP